MLLISVILSSINLFIYSTSHKELLKTIYIFLLFIDTSLITISGIDEVSFLIFSIIDSIISPLLILLGKIKLIIPFKRSINIC